MKAFQTKNGNYIFNNGGEFCYLENKQMIVPNTSTFTTERAISEGAQPIELDLTSILESHAKIQAEKQRIVDLRSQIKPLIAQKLTIKEKNVIKKQIKKDAENGETFFTGKLTVTDSSRRTGGYFNYTNRNYEGLFTILKGEIYQNGKCLVSSRKKNYSRFFTELTADEFAKAEIKEAEQSRTETYIKEAKKFNAELMLANVDIFKDELVKMLTI